MCHINMPIPITTRYCDSMQYAEVFLGPRPSYRGMVYNILHREVLWIEVIWKLTAS